MLGTSGKTPICGPYNKVFPFVVQSGAILTFDPVITMPRRTYSLGFTAAALLLPQSLQIAEWYATTPDWKLIRTYAVAENRLGFRTPGSASRIGHELVARLSTLTPAQLALLHSGTPAEQRHLSWLALCKQYRIIREFAEEVLHERFARLLLNLPTGEFEAFISSKAAWHPELEKVSPTTIRRSQNMLYQIMREANLLAGDDVIQRQSLSAACLRAILDDDPTLLSIFPAQLPVARPS